MISKSPSQRGFTLMEALIVIAVIGSLLYAILGIFGGIARQWNAQTARAKAIEMANLGMDRMAKEISQAVAYNAHDASKSDTFSMPASVDASGAAIPYWHDKDLTYASGGRIQFYLAYSATTGNVLWRQYNLSPNGNAGWIPDVQWSLQPGSFSHGRVERVSALVFTQPAGISNVVTIQLTVAWPEGPTTATYTVQREVYMINHN